MEKETSILKKIFKFILIIISICILIFGLYVYKEYEEANVYLQNNNIQKKVEEIRSKKNYTKLEDMTEIYVKGLVAVEDHRFYSHIGIDYMSIIRAINNNFKKGKLAEGGSSITQQLIKNLLLTQDRTFERKIREAILALEIEKIYSKNEILELYINLSYFGNGYYGIKEASEGYFGKTPKELSIDEAILLIGLPNAPSVYNPRENMELAKQRRKQVIDKMIVYSQLDEKTAKEVLEKEIILKEE